MDEMFCLYDPRRRVMKFKSNIEAGGAQNVGHARRGCALLPPTGGDEHPHVVTPAAPISHDDAGEGYVCLPPHD